MKVLEVSGLCKRYEKFALHQVSFSLEEGRILGFIGRNGAGKTTTLKSLLNFVHPDAGSIHFFGMDFAHNEAEIKRHIGYVAGGVSFYPNKKLRAITSITRSFYDNWDDAAYRDALQRFHLDEDKTPAQLSAGMKVKYSLALALSHNAQLLLLDEPTSGLDPVSRDELLDIFLQLSREGKSILFSTHIITDLDKCADDIVYIRNGCVCAADTLENFASAYRAVEFTEGTLTTDQQALLLGCKQGKHTYAALVKAKDAPNLPIPAQTADLETIMVHLEREVEAC